MCKCFFYSRLMCQGQLEGDWCCNFPNIQFTLVVAALTEHGGRDIDKLSSRGWKEQPRLRITSLVTRGRSALTVSNYQASGFGKVNSRAVVLVQEEGNWKTEDATGSAEAAAAKGLHGNTSLLNDFCERALALIWHRMRSPSRSSSRW